MYVIYQDVTENYYGAVLGAVQHLCLANFVVQQNATEGPCYALPIDRHGACAPNREDWVSLPVHIDPEQVVGFGRRALHHHPRLIEQLNAGEINPSSVGAMVGVADKTLRSLSKLCTQAPLMDNED